MIRKTLTILSLIGLLLSVSALRYGLNGAWYWDYRPLVPILVFGIILGLCRPLYHHRRRKRKKLGLCVKCGYDLRASKDRCPECGETFE